MQEAEASGTWVRLTSAHKHLQQKSPACHRKPTSWVTKHFLSLRTVTLRRFALAAGSPAGRAANLAATVGPAGKRRVVHELPYCAPYCARNVEKILGTPDD